jgi:hypothetical protein
MEINFMGYIKKYGRELKQTTWGQMSRWELGVLHEKKAIKVVDKNGILNVSIKTQPVGIVEDSNGNYIQSINGKNENQITEIFERDVRGHISKNSKLNISYCPVIFQDIDSQINKFKEEVYADKVRGIDIMVFEDIVKSF